VVSRLADTVVVTQDEAARRPGMSSHRTIDVSNLRRFLVAHLGADAELGPDLPQGEWSRAYACTAAGRDYVVRLNPTEETFAADLFAMTFAAPGIPIPRVVEVGEAFGGFYAVSERAFGAFLEELDAGELRASIPSILGTLEAMRAADTSASTGFGPWTAHGDGRYPSWRAYLLDVEREVPDAWSHGWREELEASPLASATFQTGLDALSELVPRCPELRHLLHSDMLNRNVFVADHRVSALIDWQCAMYGDFLYELAWFTFWAPWHAGLSGTDFRRAALARYHEIDLGVAGFEARMRCYEIHIGLRHLVYNAWRHDRTNLEATARRTLEVARR
jgi:hygromycin-B 4-O-kinase